jgi:hypothetical protein
LKLWGNMRPNIVWESITWFSVISNSVLLCMQVTFCDFPEVLLCGEVHCIEVEFFNKGTVPLHKVRVATSSPAFFTFGTGPEEELPRYRLLYCFVLFCTVKPANSTCISPGNPWNHRPGGQRAAAVGVESKYLALGRKKKQCCLLECAI